MKKSLPYGKILNNLQKQQLRPANSVYLWTGSKGRQQAYESSICRPQRTLWLPHWDLPDDYWWPVKGCDILLIDTGQPDGSDSEEKYIERIVVHLYRYGAAVVRSISPSYNLTIYHKED